MVMIGKPFPRPMLAPREVPPLAGLSYPLYVSPKIDGVRAIVWEGRVYSRSGKLIPNDQVQEQFGHHSLNGIEGELVVGEPNATDVFRETMSMVMSERASSEDLRFYAFDRVDDDVCDFETRDDELYQLHEAVWETFPGLFKIGTWSVYTQSALVAKHKDILELGYEGTMVKNPKAFYKHGRCTLRENIMFKLKEWADSEAVLLRIEEGETNGNEPTIDELGFVVRSTAKKGMKPSGAAGTLIGRDLATGEEVRVSCGSMSLGDRSSLWERRTDWYALPDKRKVFTYKHMPGAYKGKRHPTFKGWRKEGDLPLPSAVEEALNKRKAKHE